MGIKLPTSVIIPLGSQLKVQRIEPLLFHIMLKQGISNRRFNNFKLYFQNKMSCEFTIQWDLIYVFLKCSLLENTIDVNLKVHTLRGIHILRKIISPRLRDAFHGELSTTLLQPVEEN